MTRVLVFLMLLIACPAWATIIDRVEISGNKRVPEDRIRPYIISAGSEFDPEQISLSIARLHDTRYFIEISVDAAVIDNQFTITYFLRETPLIASVRFEGSKQYTEEKLLSTVTLRRGQRLDPDALGTSIMKLQMMYENDKYFNVRINHSIEYLNETSVNLVFNIEEGKKSRVYNIWFFGNENVNDDELKNAMTTKEKDFWSVMNASGKLIREVVELDDRRKLLDHYQSLGYINAQIGEAQIDFQEDPSRMNYIVRVQEGPRYKVNSIRFEQSLNLFTEEELKEAIGIKEGEYFNVPKFREDIRTLTDKFGEVGYAWPDINPDVLQSYDDRSVDITFKITEGPKVYINRIVFIGNERTRDNVLRREFDIHEGDLFNRKLINEGRSNLIATGYFNAPGTSVSERQVPGKENEADVEVRVSEAKNGSINFAVAYSTQEQFMGRVEFAQANLMGYGSILKVMAEVSNQRQDYQISYTEPWLFDRPYVVGVEVYSRFKEYTEYDKQTRGGALRLGHQPIKRRLFLNYRLAHERVEISDIADNATIYIREQEGRTVINSITPSITYSVLNNRLDPSDGITATARVKYAGTFLGGDADFAKLTGDISYYRPLNAGFVGVVHAEAGQIWSINDTRLPIDERFFLGGMYSLRGFETREVSPKDENGNSYGGDKYYQLNLEVWRPLFEGNVSIRGVVFFDMGQVFDDGESFTSADPRMSAGAGIRLFTPLGLLRFETGYKLNRKEGEDAYRMEFSIGSAF